MTDDPHAKRTHEPPENETLPPDVGDPVEGAGEDEGPATGPANATGFPIVGIGASAGGLAAFEAFFSALPQAGDSGMAFVLVQHLSPDHKSALVDLVQRYTRMRVHEVADGMAVEPNCTYVIPPGHDMALEEGRLRLTAIGDRHRPHLTVDHFFASLAAAQHERAICIVLAGTGSDGTQGLREVKGEGGLVIAQAPNTTEYDGMPSSAIATGMVDYVLSPADMPATLRAYVRHAYDLTRAPVAQALHDGVLKRICALLRLQTGHDFSQYKETTLVRRIERRMALHQIHRIEDYLTHAREHSPELNALFRDLLIGVTHFFRDPDAFNALSENVVARLMAGKSTGEPLRVWVCGCSTGEEAYSIGILLQEHMAKVQRPLRVQIFATDIDGAAIDKARSGVYLASIAANISEERLERFFTHDAQRGTYRIRKDIRDTVVFSEQDAIKDPPFSRLDLVSCRNLLIYLNADLQRRLISLFHYALAPGGALFLGPSETVGESARLFHVVDRKWKIYTRQPAERGSQRHLLSHFLLPPSDSPERLVTPAAAEAAQDLGNLRQITEKALISHYGPAAVLIDGRGQILHIVGRTGQFLEPADGDASMNILAMARDGLRRELTVAVHQAVANKQPVSCAGLKVKSGGETTRANLSVRPVESGGGMPLYLVILEEVLEAAVASDGRGSEADDQGGRIAELKRELRAKDEYLQTTLEEMETTNEELKSTNEEMQSVNEELQSTNEELETSKEELQSLNEELSTLNTELQHKVNDLSRASNDMNNLLAGTGVGTLFVDHQLRIARFTPAATQVINFIAGDIGRPLEHVASNIVGYDRMVEDIRAVLDTLVPREAEVQVKGGAWYLMRIRPYRTMDNLIEGAVITLVDISERKKAEASLRHSEARLNVFINQAFAGVSETDLDGRLLFANDRLCETLGYGREGLLGRRVAELTDPEDVPRVQAKVQALAKGGVDVQFEKRWVRQDGVRVRTLERVSAIRDGTGQPGSLLWLSFDLADAQGGARER